LGAAGEGDFAMAMSVGNETGPHAELCDMNTTPLIDVMLVLLVMLIVTIPIQTHAVKIDLPRGAPPDPAPAIDLEIDFDGTPIWNGTPVPSRAQLANYFVATAAQIPQPEIHVRPSRLAKYDVVARTLADAQRLGIARIGFVGNDQYAE
jgi:biopolymer transport protein ExbD